MIELFVFVEGSDDERFFRWYFEERNVKIIPYASMQKKEITGIIKSLEYRGIDYIFTADADGASIEEKTDKIVEKYGVDSQAVSIVQYEIESWYLAGIDEEETKKYKIRYYSNTDDITKEKFNSMIPKRYTSISFKIDILKKFKVGVAKERNKTFCSFSQNNKKEQVM